MKQQNYKKHRKFSVIHHFILMPLLFALTVVGVYKAINVGPFGEKLAWALFALSLFLLLAVLVFMRQHYALGNQNRIVRLEFRLRYFELFGHPASAVEPKLSFGQIAALRFADDNEFKELLQQTLAQNLSPTQIKRSIKNWQGDYMRV